MAKLPDVPQVLRVKFIHKINTDVDVLDTLHFAYTGGAPSNSDCATLAGGFEAAYVSDLLGLLGNDKQLTEVICTDLTSDTAGQGDWTGAETGTRSGGGYLTAATALLLNYQIDRRYRGGKPRSYFPWGVQDDLDSQQTWTSGFLSSVSSSFASFITACAALSSGTTDVSGHVNVSYYGPPNRYVGTAPGRVKTYSTVQAAATVDQIVSYSVNSKVGSQRRRTGRKT